MNRSKVLEELCEMVSSADREELIIIAALAYAITDKDAIAESFPKDCYIRAGRRLSAGWEKFPDKKENFQKAIDYLLRKMDAMVECL